MWGTPLRLVFGVAMSVGIAAAAASPALALTDEIAYRCDVDICLVQPDAPGAVTNLTDNGTASLDGAPSWSPDGTRVAFVSTFGGGGQNIFVMQPDAPGQAVNLATQLTHYPSGSVSITNIAWSRDGTRVAYDVSASYGAKTGVFVVAADGTTVTPVTIAAATLTSAAAHPTWSPDGTKIAYSREEQVFVTSSDGTGSPAPLENGGGHSPAWSPDGTKIAFDGINAQEHDPFVDLHVVNAGGGGRPAITPIYYTQWTFAAWSPDGTRIAYRSTAAGDPHIRVGRGDGSRDVPLVHAAQENVYTPSWSPDGSRITYEGYRGALAEPNEIYVVAADGSGSERPLTTGGKSHEPAWRPNPPPPLFTPGVTPPAPTAGSSVPGPVQKPTVVWITKRIPWTPGPLRDLLAVAVYSCNGPACSVASSGTARSSGSASTATAAKKKPRKKKPRTVVVARGHMEVPAGASRPLKLTLTRAGATLLRARRNLTISVTVTTTGPARPKTVERKQIRVYVKPVRRKR